MWSGSHSLQRSVVPELRQIDGFQGVHLLRRSSPEDVEIVVLTIWESMEAIRKFAGENPEVAVVAPAARPLFRKYDMEVQHFEIVLNLEATPLVGELGSNLCS